MPIDLDVEPSRPVPDREAERPREPRREFSDRVDGVVRDVVAFRTVAGAVKASDVGHECAVYRAACAAAERIEAAGGRVERVRVDAELKGRVAVHAERVRQAKGRAAAERCRAAAELDLPIEQGKVLFPDAQIEYVNAAGRAGRCNVEVVSQHYASDTIRSKAAAGFQMYAAGSRAADFVQRALASGGGDRGRRGGRGARRELEVFEI